MLPVSVIGIVGLVLLCKRRKEKQAPKATPASSTCKFENHAYGTCETNVGTTKNEYSTCQLDYPVSALHENPLWENGSYHPSCQFDNPGYTVSEKPLETQENDYSSLNDDEIYDVIVQPAVACVPGIAKQATVKINPRH